MISAVFSNAIRMLKKKKYKYNYENDSDILSIEQENILKT